MVSLNYILFLVKDFLYIWGRFIVSKNQYNGKKQEKMVIFKIKRVNVQLNCLLECLNRQKMTNVQHRTNSWARGAPQQLAISMAPRGAILLVRFELIASRSLYVISTRFSLLISPPLCTHYISNVGIKIGLNSFQNCPYVTTFLLRSISVFTYKKQSDFGKNWVPQKQLFLDRAILERDPSQKYWTSAILERMESEVIFGIAYYLIYLVKTLWPARFWKEWHLLNTNTFSANPDQNNLGKNWFQIQFLRLKVLTRLSNSLYILFLQSNIYFH